MAKSSAHGAFTAALDALVEQIKQDRSHPRGDPLRQPVARHRLGEVGHRPGARDDRRQEVRERRHRALRRRRQRARVPDAARGVPARSSKARCATRSCTRSSPRAGCSTRTTRPLPTLCRRPARARRARPPAAAAARGHQRAPRIYKAHKWFVTRGDLDYTALWILYAATPLAQIEVIGAGLLADREVIPQAMTLNPAFFKTVYTDLLNDEEDAEDGRGRARRRRRIPCRSAPRRSSRRSSSTCARSARRGRPPRSRTISRGTST